MADKKKPSAVLTDRKPPVAVLTLVVEYDDEMPPTEDLKELVEKAREYGAPRRADLVVMAPATIDLLK